ncbi:hypothetical protein [Nocardioides bruguierae]|uniref:Uncharacterized protein n=1 Tax=Nocardioides bruguierae TaxID=2945102 RepID=A0A9X2DAK0_9ACTN|nr:hypothetical protein [Nocardioides bruguierae]MCM0622186.1 hypothetical protein [Nocardioides bruguierae]
MSAPAAENIGTECCCVEELHPRWLPAWVAARVPARRALAKCYLCAFARRGRPGRVTLDLLDHIANKHKAVASPAIRKRGRRG